jgi:small nuclear ribonucleoprotein (snRNP)-like protein
MNHPKHVFFFALILSTFGATASPLRAARSDWDNLNNLNPGEQIRVVLKDAKSYQGEFKAVDGQGITLQRAAGAETFAQKDVHRVFVKGKNHLARNMVIGGAIGAVLFALPAALAIAHNGDMPATPSGAVPWVVFVPMGALVGAAMPTGQWREVYRARQH